MYVQTTSKLCSNETLALNFDHPTKERANVHAVPHMYLWNPLALLLLHSHGVCFNEIFFVLFLDS